MSEVGWNGRPDGSGRTWFTVRAEVDNPDHALRPGMSGIAKAWIGLRPAGELLLRPVWRSLNMHFW